MNLDPTTISINKNGDQLEATIEGQIQPIDRLARAFPRSNPDQYISLIDQVGHEIGIIENPEKLDGASQELLAAELKAIYFIPTIKEIHSVTPKGTGSLWEATTDDGKYEFRISGRDALDGNAPPQIDITDEGGKRYTIESYWDLDAESRDLIFDLLPDKILKAKYFTKSMSGRSSKSSRGGKSRGGSMMMSMR